MGSWGGEGAQDVQGEPIAKIFFRGRGFGREESRSVWKYGVSRRTGSGMSVGKLQEKVVGWGSLSGGTLRTLPKKKVGTKEKTGPKKSRRVRPTNR